MCLVYSITQSTQSLPGPPSGAILSANPEWDCRVVPLVVLWPLAGKYCRTDCIVDLIPRATEFGPNSGFYPQP